jgi:hypothetical protein
MPLWKDALTPSPDQEPMLHELAHVIDSVGFKNFTSDLLHPLDGMAEDLQSIEVERMILSRFRTEKARNDNEIRATAITILLLQELDPSNEDHYGDCFMSMRANLSLVVLFDTLEFEKYENRLGHYLKAPKTKRQADHILKFLRSL